MKILAVLVEFPSKKPKKSIKLKEVPTYQFFLFNFLLNFHIKLEYLLY